MPDQRPLQWTPKSERVVQLLGTCIRTAVRLRHARQLSQEDALDLARVHDLQSALKTFAAKMELHRNLPEGHAFKLAVAETKLASEANLGTDKIIAIRELSIATLEANQSNSSERQQLIAALQSVQQEARLWAKAYSRFLTEIETLYKNTNAQIDSLRLPLGKRLQAQSELEQLIVDTIRRVGDVSA